MATYFYAPVMQQVTQTFINPYSGYELEVDGLYGIDVTPYHGTSGTDALFMTAVNEILNIEDSSGNQKFSSIEIIFGSAGEDILNLASTTYTLGAMTIYGNDGDDVIWSNDGNDILYGDNGNDILDGGAGDDYIYGGLEDDTLFGGAGDDFLNGQSGNDIIHGDAGGDRLFGSSGNDNLIGGAGDDLINGGDDFDTAYYSMDYSQYNITAISTGLTVEALVGDEGTDTIDDSVEKLVFANGEYENGVFTQYNLAPVAEDDEFTLDQDTNIIANLLEDNGNGEDSDPDGDTLSVVAGTYATANGTVLIASNGDFMYTPDAGFYGTDSFDYTLEDGQGHSDIGTASFTVVQYIPPNEKPVLGKDSASVDEDSSVTINVLANDYDPNGDTLTVVSVSNLVNGSAVINPDNTITYTPDPDFFGAESFLYVVSDGNGGFQTQRINVTINEVADEVEPNVGPVLEKDNATMDEDTSVTLNVLANDYDPNGDTLTVISVGSLAHGTAVINGDSTITYTPDENFHGEESFVYTVSDGNGGYATQRINIIVNDVTDPEPSNAAPDLGKDNFTMGDNESKTLNVQANDVDPDGDIMTVISVADVTHGTVIINANNTLTYTPDTDYVGSESFIYTVSDGNGGFATQRVNVTINDTDDIYTFDNSDFVTPETISAFESGDALDISDILSGYDPLSDAITDFVQIIDNGSDTIISVDADGGADNFVQIATLIDVVGLTDESALETSGTLITV
mgnify:CR=1 FL=1